MREQMTVIPIALLAMLGHAAIAQGVEFAGHSASNMPGIVIAHSAAESGRFIGSPSIVMLSDGTYLASHDFFGPKAGGALSCVYASRNRGETWEKIADIHPLFWGKLFVHGANLYVLGTRHGYGDVLIRSSKDGGRTWTEPQTRETGLLRQGRYHCAPCPTLVHGGRIWRSIERRHEGGGGRDLEALVMSAPVDADLLNASSWVFSASLSKPEGFSWLEGNVLLDPAGKIVNVLRTNGVGDDKAAIAHVNPEGTELSYDHEHDFIDMPGGGAKFTIRYDGQTSRYWSLVNPQTNPRARRNTLALTSSADLRTWRVEAPLLHHPEQKAHAWQYIDWQFEGDDIIFVSRTAFDDGLGGARNFHDANYLTFHRIRGFRNGPPFSGRPESLSLGEQDRTP